MSRRILLAASLVFVCGSASAQNQVGSASLVPITAPVQHLGTFNWATKSWMAPERAEQLRAATTVVYNNTCTWTVTNFYSNNSGTCTTYIDEGRIPSPTSPNAPAGATTDNNITSFEFAYCSLAATGTVDIKIGFYDNLGGGCLQGLGNVPYTTPIQNNAVAYFDFGATAGFPLSGNGFCYTVNVALGNTGFCLQSDGNGMWDNGPLNDELFNWSFESDSPDNAGAVSTGPVIAGDPALSAIGGCTYNIPCGTDPSPLFAANTSCGHGLDTADRWWVNHDGDFWGDGVNTGATCPGVLPNGSTCYWYNGYVNGNTFASFHLQIASAGSCGGCNGSPLSYCTSGTTSAISGSCVAVMGLRSGDIPSASNPAPAFLDATSVPGQKNGLIFLGLAPLASTPWGPNGHFLCIAAPTQRTVAGNTNGTTGQCDGQISLDINQELASFGILGQSPTNGQTIYAQGWFRDPGSSKTTAMTNGLSVTLCP